MSIISLNCNIGKSDSLFRVELFKHRCHASVKFFSAYTDGLLKNSNRRKYVLLRRLLLEKRSHQRST